MAKYSLGEIDALARKATRGAGYSWGIAEETGKSVRWLSAYGFSGAEALAEHLLISANQHQNLMPKLINDEPYTLKFQNKNKQSSLCALSCCALINDLGHHIQADKVLSFNHMLFPLLALSAAGRVAETYEIAVLFEYDETEIICDSNGIRIKTTPPLLNDITFSSSESVKRPCAELGFLSSISSSSVLCKKIQTVIKNTHYPNPQSREIPQKIIDTLEKFAHKTYAPESEESRLRGAG